MNTTQHTPGPWSDTGFDGKEAIVIESNTGSVCAVWRVNGYACQEADARLIASAPELLSACEAFLELFKSGKNSDRQNPYTRPEVKAAIAAIAKAKGGEA